MIHIHLERCLQLWDQKTFGANEHKIAWSGEFVYQITVCLYKLSIIFVYYRIFVLKRFRAALHLVLGFISAYFVWSILQTLLQCLPFAAIWRIYNSPHQGDRCIPARAHLLSLAVANVIIDWTLLFLPIPIIWTLKMSLVNKVEVTIVIAIGALSVSVLRSGTLADVSCHQGMCLQHYPTD